MIRTLRSEPPFGELRALMRAASTDDPQLRADVAAILAGVVAGGDEALLDYTARFDRLQVTTVADLRIGASADCPRGMRSARYTYYTRSMRCICARRCHGNPSTRASNCARVSSSGAVEPGAGHWKRP